MSGIPGRIGRVVASCVFFYAFFYAISWLFQSYGCVAATSAFFFAISLLLLSCDENLNTNLALAANATTDILGRLIILLKRSGSLIDGACRSTFQAAYDFFDTRVRNPKHYRRAALHGHLQKLDLKVKDVKNTGDDRAMLLDGQLQNLGVIVRDFRNAADGRIMLLENQQGQHATQLDTITRRQNDFLRRINHKMDEYLPLVEHLLKDLKLLGDGLASLSSQYIESKGEISALRSDIDDLQTVNDAFETRHKESEEELSTLRTDIGDLRTVNAASETQHEDSKTAIIALREENAAKETQYQESKEAIKDLEDKNVAFEQSIEAKVQTEVKERLAVAVEKIMQEQLARAIDDGVQKAFDEKIKKHVQTEADAFVQKEVQAFTKGHVKKKDLETACSELQGQLETKASTSSVQYLTMDMMGTQSDVRRLTDDAKKLDSFSRSIKVQLEEGKRKTQDQISTLTETFQPELDALETKLNGISADTDRLAQDQAQLSGQYTSLAKTSKEELSEIASAVKEEKNDKAKLTLKIESLSENSKEASSAIEQLRKDEARLSDTCESISKESEKRLDAMSSTLEEVQNNENQLAAQYRTLSNYSKQELETVSSAIKQLKTDKTAVLKQLKKDDFQLLRKVERLTKQFKNRLTTIRSQMSHLQGTSTTSTVLVDHTTKLNQKGCDLDQDVATLSSRFNQWRLSDAANTSVRLPSTSTGNATKESTSIDGDTTLDNSSDAEDEESNDDSDTEDEGFNNENNLPSHMRDASTFDDKDSASNKTPNKGRDKRTRNRAGRHGRGTRMQHGSGKGPNNGKTSPSDEAKGSGGLPVIGNPPSSDPNSTEDPVRSDTGGTSSPAPSSGRSENPPTSPSKNVPTDSSPTSIDNSPQAPPGSPPAGSIVPDVTDLRPAGSSDPAVTPPSDTPVVPSSDPSEHHPDAETKVLVEILSWRTSFADILQDPTQPTPSDGELGPERGRDGDDKGSPALPAQPADVPKGDVPIISSLDPTASTFRPSGTPVHSDDTGQRNVQPPTVQPPPSTDPASSDPPGSSSPNPQQPASQPSITPGGNGDGGPSNPPASPDEPSSPDHPSSPTDPSSGEQSGPASPASEASSPVRPIKVCTSLKS